MNSAARGVPLRVGQRAVGYAPGGYRIHCGPAVG
jgi:hypothetical protein